MVHAIKCLLRVGSEYDLEFGLSFLSLSRYLCVVVHNFFLAFHLFMTVHNGVLFEGLDGALVRHQMAFHDRFVSKNDSADYHITMLEIKFILSISFDKFLPQTDDRTRCT